MKKSFLFLPWLALSSQIAFAAPTRISGVARNGSAANRPLADAAVQLIRPANPAKNLARTTLATTQTDSAGRFTFAPREYGADDLLMANVSQGGFDYPVVAFDGAKKLKQVGIDVNPAKVELLVFDTTTKPVRLDYQVHHLAISSIETGSSTDANTDATTGGVAANSAPSASENDSGVTAGIHCIERIVVHNHSTSTLMGVGPRQVSLLLDLPKGAKNVQLDPKVVNASPGAKLINTPSGWGLVRPITPDAYGAQNAIIVSYDMEWPSVLPWKKSIDLSRKVIYPTKFFFVARKTGDKELQISAPKLSPDTEAPVPIEGQTEVRLINSIGAPMMPQGGAPPALGDGQDLKISVSRPVSATFWGFAAMTIALCLFLPVAMIKPRRKSGASAAKGNFAEPPLGALVIEQSSGTGPQAVPFSELGPHLALTPESRDLIQKIADLDDQREAGQVDDATYQSQRAAWKTRLLESLGASTRPL